jgi:predicted transcriptional regulator
LVAHVNGHPLIRCPQDECREINIRQEKLRTIVGWCPDLNDLHSLLFELSNKDRLIILDQLAKGAINVTNLSKRSGLTIQEASRHISRLGKAMLIFKDSAGSWHLTSYGKLVLRQTEGFKFLSQNEGYFVSHSLARLPIKFVSRLADLVGSTFVKEVVVSFANVENMVRDADEYVWTITDQYLISRSTLASFLQAFDRGVCVKNIEAKDWVVPDCQIGLYNVGDKELREHARTSGLLMERFSEQLDLCLYMSEKEVALLAFPSVDGRFDYLGFTSKEEQTHQWCFDIFNHYWEKAVNRQTIVDELCQQIEKMPNIVNLLEKIAARKEVTDQRELVLQLDNMRLTKQGKLTALGRLVYRRLKE